MEGFAKENYRYNRIHRFEGIFLDFSNQSILFYLNIIQKIWFDYQKSTFSSFFLARNN